MHNISTVAIIYRGEDLFDDVCRILLAKNFLLGNSLEKFTPVAQSIAVDKKRKLRHDVGRENRNGRLKSYLMVLKRKSGARITYSVTK